MKKNVWNVEEKMKKWIVAVISMAVLVLLVTACNTSKVSQKTPVMEDKVTDEKYVLEEKNEDNEIKLEIIDLKCETGEYGWAYITGRVENKGIRDASFVKVNIDLFNDDGWVLSEFTYVRNTDIPAGGIDSFKKTVIDPPDWTRCEAFVTYY